MYTGSFLSISHGEHRVDDTCTKLWALGSLLNVRWYSSSWISGKSNRIISHDIELTGIISQTPRPMLSHRFEKLVREHTRFYYCDMLQQYISAGFYTKNTFDPHYLPEKRPPTTHLSHSDVEGLFRSSTNTLFMTVPEYFQAYRELTALNATHFLLTCDQKNRSSYWIPVSATKALL